MIKAQLRKTETRTERDRTTDILVQYPALGPHNAAILTWRERRQPSLTAGPGTSQKLLSWLFFFFFKTNVLNPTWLAGGHGRIWGSTKHSRVPGCTPPQYFSTDSARLALAPSGSCGPRRTARPRQTERCCPAVTHACLWGASAKAGTPHCQVGLGWSRFPLGLELPQASLLILRTLGPTRIPP